MPCWIFILSPIRLNGQRLLMTGLLLVALIWTSSDCFSKGIVWRGVVNASQTPQMQASQGISQVFMGLNMKCASCHDSFINDWQLSDAYGLANIYADDQLEIFQCDKPTGKKAVSK